MLLKLIEESRNGINMIRFFDLNQEVIPVNNYKKVQLLHQ